MFCDKCGKEFDDSHSFCPNCGAEKSSPPTPPIQLPPTPTPVAPPTPPPVQPYYPQQYPPTPVSKKSRKGIGCGGSILFLILLIIVIVIIVSLSKKETPTTTPTQTTTQPSQTTSAPPPSSLSSFETVGMFDNSPSMVAISYYDANPTKAAVTSQCNELKARFIDSGITTNLRISFFDNRENTPDYSRGYDIPESSQQYEFANYFYNASNSQTRLLFLKEIPE